MKSLRDERRDRDTRERMRRDDDRDRRATTDVRRVGGRPEGRQETDLDEREYLVRTSRVADRPFG
ncbi:MULTISPECIES: hypothetical protein [unclassified Streptomyces]|uniref:hypothetical protein n=1 Tax=unclassified Streptomyces TaxID=2593676 RepID=UPI0035D815A4